VSATSDFFDVRVIRKKKKKILAENYLSNNLMVNSHACISTYLQIDQDTSSRRDESSTKHVSNQNTDLYRNKMHAEFFFYLHAGNI
jgi:hypothetical protein